MAMVTAVRHRCSLSNEPTEIPPNIEKEHLLQQIRRLERRVAVSEGRRGHMLDVKIQVSRDMYNVSVQTDSVESSKIARVQKTFVDAATQHCDFEKVQMKKRITHMEEQHRQQQALSDRRITHMEELSQDKDRLITALKQEIEQLQSKPSSLPVNGKELNQLRAQVEDLKGKTETLRTKVKELQKPAKESSKNELPAPIPQAGMVLKDVARLRRQTMIDALRLSVLPKEFILPLSEIENLCRTERDVDRAIWRSWWIRIADAMGALQETSAWEERWIYSIIQLAESASVHFTEPSDQITAIMQAFWRGDEEMRGSHEDVKAIFKMAPVLAITCWMTHAKDPWVVYAETASNLLSFIPKVIYWRHERSIGGYDLTTLAEKSMESKNLDVALGYLYETDLSLAQEVLTRKSTKNPLVILKWRQLLTRQPAPSLKVLI